MRKTMKIIGGFIGLSAIAAAAYIAGNLNGQAEACAEAKEGNWNCECGGNCKLYDDEFGTVTPFNEEESRLVAKYSNDLRELVAATEDFCDATQSETVTSRTASKRDDVLSTINRIKSTNYIYDSADPDNGDSVEA